MEGPSFSINISIAIFLLVQTGSLIWFLSKLSATLSFTQTRVSNIEEKLGNGSMETFYRKENAEKEFFKIDAQLKDILRILHNVRDRLHSVEGYINVRKLKDSQRESQQDLEV